MLAIALLWLRSVVAPAIRGSAAPVDRLFLDSPRARRWLTCRAVRVVTFRDPHGVVRVGRLEEDRLVVLRAPTMLEWLHGEGHEPAAREHALQDIALRAPVPQPPSLRDFFAYEDHVAAGWRLRGGEIPPAWHEAPTFYFSNPASIHGPGEPARRPAATGLLDFE